MNRKAILGALFAVLLVAGFLCVWKLQAQLDQKHTALQFEEGDLALRSPSVMKKLSLEYAPLLAAIYWTRVVQYFGWTHQMHDQNLDLLWPLLDITTTLDPHLIVAYRFGSTFLSDAPPRGAGQPDLAVKLLQRGIAANPDVWRLYQDLGNVYYFDKKDYLRASQAFEAGSKFPGTPPWMKIMAAKIAAERESLETSYALWMEVYRAATSKEILQNAQEHLRLVNAEMDLRELDRLGGEFEQKTHRRATRISDLVDAGFLPGQPQDPDGFPYVMDPSGKAEIHPKSPLHEDWMREKSKSF